MKNIFVKKAKEIINSIIKQSTDLIVIKGIDLDDLGLNKVDLESKITEEDLNGLENIIKISKNRTKNRRI